MKTFKLLLATAALAVSGSALAGPSYTYADFSYSEALFGTTDAIAVSGSYAVTDQIHLLGSYVDGETDLLSDFDGYSVGVGYNRAMTDNMDLVFRVGYADIDVDLAGSSDVITFEVGPRAMVTDDLELNAAVTYVDSDDLDASLAGLRVGGQLYFDNISVGATVETNEITTALGFNVRYSW
jgi:hypothetical protein